MRVVLDTNVLVAAFISHGVCAEIFDKLGFRSDLLRLHAQLFNNDVLDSLFYGLV